MHWPPMRNTYVGNREAYELSIPAPDIKPTYSRRIVRCNNGCSAWTDTTYKQMWTPQGFRAMTCAQCRIQGRTQHWICVCHTKWYRCPIHRIDPPTHEGNKPAANFKKPILNSELLPTSRTLPTVRKRESGASHTNIASMGACQFTNSVGSAGTRTNAPVTHFGLSIAACPRLASKFLSSHPHLFNAASVEGPQASNCDRIEGVPSSSVGDEEFTSSHTGLLGMQSCELAPYVPMHEDSSGSCGTVLPRLIGRGSVRPESTRS